MQRRRPGASPARGKRVLEDRAWILLNQKQLSASRLAAELEVSEITAKRIIAALKKAGWEIASVRVNGHSHYEIRDRHPWEELERDPLLTTLIPAGKAHPPRGKPEDRDYDSD